MTAGQLFIVKGQGFNNWPSQIVLGHDEESVMSENYYSLLMRVVSRTNTELVFQYYVDHTFQVETTWKYFGSPDSAPRTILSYK